MDIEPVKDPHKMSYDATTALFIYELKDRNDQDEHAYMYDRHNPPNCFVTMHRIHDGLVCEGAPVTRRKLNALCKRMLPALATEAFYFPETLITYTPFETVMVWWHPAGIKYLYFEDGTGTPCGKAPLPALLFKYSNIGLSTFALKENKRPTENSSIYHTPFFNFGCMGNVRLPKNPTPKDIPRLEELFFRSAFTDHNPPKLKGTTGKELWNGLISSQAKKFPMQHLVKAGSLKTMLKGAVDD